MIIYNVVEVEVNIDIILQKKRFLFNIFKYNNIYYVYSIWQMIEKMEKN